MRLIQQYSLLASGTRLLLLLAGGALTFGLPCAAQDVSANPPNSFPATGLYSTGSYAPGNIESVNVTNGNVSLNFPLAKLPAGPGGFTAGVSLIYNSAIYDASAVPTSASQAKMPYVPSGHGGGWGYGYKYTLWAQPRIPAAWMTQSICNLLSTDEQTYWYKNYLQTPDGSNHALYLITENPTTGHPNPDAGHGDAGFLSTDFGGFGNPACVTQQQYTGTLVFGTVDNTAIRVEVSAHPGSSSAVPWTAYLPDGTTVGGNLNFLKDPVSLSPSIGQAWTTDDSPAGLITDRNGNTLTITPLCEPDTPCTDVLTDGQGRTVSVQYASAGTAGVIWTDTISSSGPNGQLLTQVNSTMESVSGINYECLATTSGSVSSPTCAMNVQLWHVNSIVMPATQDTNQTTFAFDYSSGGSNSWGELHSVQKCVGTGLTSCSSGNTQWTVAYAYEFDGSATRPSGTTISPITSKTLTYTETLRQNTTPVQHTINETTNYSIGYPSYSYLPYQSVTLPSNTVTAPNGSVTTFDLRSLCFSSTATWDTCSPVVYEVHNPDGSTVETAWSSATGGGPAGAPSGAFVNPYPAGALETRAGFSRASVTNQDLNGNALETGLSSWISSTSSSIMRTSGFYQYVSCLSGSLVTCRTKDVATPYQYTSGASYLTPSYSTSPTYQPFLRAISSVSISGGNGSGTTVAAYSYDNYATTGNVTQITSYDSVQGALNQYMTYLGNGNLTSETDLNGVSTIICYDSLNLYPVKVVTVAASGASCPSPTEKPEGRTATYTYATATGLPSSMTDADNHIDIAYAYDYLGRPKSVTEAAGNFTRTTSTTYDDVNMKIMTTQDDITGQALATTSYYDPLGRISLSVDGANDAIQFAYRYGPSSGTGTLERFRLQSNPYVSTSDATMGWTLTTLDSVGRPIETDSYKTGTMPGLWGSSTALTGTSTVAYDQTLSGCTGPGTTVTDEAPNTHWNCADALGRLTAVTEPDPSSGAAGTVTAYTYDGVTDQLSAVDSGGLTGGSACAHMRCFVYSSLARLQSAWNPESGTTSYTYDNNGNVLTRQDANENVTTWSSYDGLNRPASVSYALHTPPPSSLWTTAATPSVSYTYDGDFKGALSSVSNSASATCYFHDALGRVSSSMQVASCSTPVAPYTFSYGYSLTDVLTSMTYPSGRTVTYSPDAADRITSVNGSYLSNPMSYASVTYNAPGAPSTVTMGNTSAVTQAFTWNDHVQPTQLAVTGAGSASLLTLNFYPCDSQATSCTSGNNGNLWSQKIQTASGGLNVTQSYQYDHLNRLTCANEAATSPVTCGSGGSNWTQTYGQDTLGNNWFNTSTGTGLPSLTAETPQSSGSFSTSAPNQIVGWTYDYNGNLIVEGSVARSFSYDVENRQVTANMNGAVSSYVYDGDGQRVSKTSGGVTTTYVYDAFGNEAAEYIGANDASACGTPTCFVMEDHLGSTRMLTDSNGSYVRRYDYLPFGQELSAGAGGRTLAMGYLNAPDDVSPKFTGQDRNQETSLDWFQVRYMDGAQGRFQSVDPGNAGANLGDPRSWNGYSYVGNNPMSFTDPSGMDGGCAICNVVGIIVEAIGVAVGLEASSGGGGHSTISPGLATPSSPILGGSSGGGGSSVPLGNSILQTQGGTPANLDDYNASIAYLSRNPRMARIIQQLRRSRKVYTISFGQFSKGDGYFPRVRGVTWAPRGSVIAIGGGCESPALLLGHELAHAYEDDLYPYWLRREAAKPDPDYDNLAERWAITGPEASAARTLGEPVRTTHHALDANARFIEPGPTSRTCR